MALGEDDDGTLHVASATPTDLGGLGRPARLSLAPAEEVEALLARFEQEPPPGDLPPSAPRSDTPAPGDALAPGGPPRDAASAAPAPTEHPAQPASPSAAQDAALPAPADHPPQDAGAPAARVPVDHLAQDAAPPAPVDHPAQDAGAPAPADHPAQDAPPPRRRRRPWVVLGILLLLAAAGAALAVLLLREDRPAPPPTGAAVVADELPAAVADRLPGPVRRVPAQAALDDLCEGRARAAVVPAPVPATPCEVRAATTVTTRATTLAAPGGGCLEEPRARELATALAGRAGAPVAGGARPVAVRAASTGACVAPTPAAVEDGTYPLVQRAVLLVVDRRAVPPLLQPLRDVADDPPVVEIGLRRALG